MGGLPVKKKKTASVGKAPYIVAAAIAVAMLAIAYLLIVTFTQNKSSEEVLFKNGMLYYDEVCRAEKDYGVERARIYAVIQTESSFDPDALSKSGAVGLMQMLPSTYEDFCRRAGKPCVLEDLKEPGVNIDVCTAYLKELYRLTGSWDWAHVAYFSGIGNVTGWRNEGVTIDRLPSANATKYLDRIKSAYDAYKRFFDIYDAQSRQETEAS